MELGPEVTAFRAFRKKMATETLAATVALMLGAAALAGTGTALGLLLGGVATCTATADRSVETAPLSPAYS